MPPHVIMEAEDYKKYPMLVRKRFNYNTPESFDYPPVFFNDVKYLGNCPMHKQIRPVENVCKLAETKYAKTHFPKMYYDPKTEKAAIEKSHEIIKQEFKDKLSVKYFVPDPINGGNSNNGPMIKKILASISVSAQILDISPVTLYRLKTCIEMMNRSSFSKVHIFEKFAKAALNSILADVGNFGQLSVSTHHLLCHGGLYIRYAQEDVGVAICDLSENSIEMGNKENLHFRKLLSRKCGLVKETWDIFKRKLLVSDFKLIIEGSLGQTIRRGNVRKERQEKEEEETPSFSSSTIVYCPWTPGGELAARWRQLEAASWAASWARWPWVQPRLDGSSRSYRYTVVEHKGWWNSELL